MSVNLHFWDRWTKNDRERELRDIMAMRDEYTKKAESTRHDIGDLNDPEFTEKWTASDVAARLARKNADLAAYTNLVQACEQCIAALRADVAAETTKS